MKHAIACLASRPEIDGTVTNNISAWLITASNKQAAIDAGYTILKYQYPMNAGWKHAVCAASDNEMPLVISDMSEVKA